MIERPEMSESEAQQAVNAIRRSAAEIGQQIRDLRERQGWKALGYHSFTAMLEGEFTYSRQHLYRLMNAARPKELSHNVTTLSPDEQALKADLEVLIEQGRERMRGGLAALEAMRLILEPKGLYESWCKNEFNLTPDEVRAQLDFEAAAPLAYED